MKRIFILIMIALMFAVDNYAQNEVDALRYSFFNPTGTSRYTAMGGAMGALGGDLSSASFNPAGIAVFRSSTISFAPVWASTKSKTNYYGETHSQNKYKLQIANIGFVSSVETSWSSENIKFVNFGLSYNNLANFNRNILISGFNNKSSLLDLETENVINGNNDNLYKKADLIYTDPNDSTKLTNDFWRHGYGAQQTKSIRSEGSAGEYTFSGGMNYKDRIYLGVAFGIVRINYKETSTYTEDPPETFPDLQYFNSKNYLRTMGSGMNLKIGIIARLTDWIRIGAAVQTPTAFSLKDTYNSEVNARIDYEKGTVDQQAKTNTSYYEWQLTTPFKASGSAAFIWGKKGLLSVDYEIIDYSFLNMEAEDYDFMNENEQIKNIYRFANNLKIGAEYKLGPLSLRAGYAYFGSPFESKYDNSIAKNSVYSVGLGFRTNKFFADFAGKYVNSNEYFYLYGTQDSKAKITNSIFSYAITVGFSF